jgi:Tfp pilus assembly protein PilX
MNARKQQGFSLLVSMIMLLLMMLLAIASFHMSSSQTTVVANAQHRNEGIDAATQAIEEVVNSSNFTQNPAAAIPNTNCTAGGGANTWCVDSNGDGVQDFTVTMPVAPTCVEAAPILNSQLNLQNPDDLACSSGTSQNFGVTGGSGSGNSMCANSTWEITAQANDPATETSATVTQGVSMRIPATAVTNNCP